ncbi:TPA: hypothetical protein ACGO2A_001144 [Streptococcus suis]
MEKLKQPPFVELKSVERLQDIYRQAYPELEAGDRIKLSRFNNFKVDWRQIEEDTSKHFTIWVTIKSCDTPARLKLHTRSESY